MQNSVFAKAKIWVLAFQLAVILVYQTFFSKIPPTEFEPLGEANRTSLSTLKIDRGTLQHGGTSLIFKETASSRNDGDIMFNNVFKIVYIIINPNLKGTKK